MSKSHTNDIRFVVLITKIPNLESKTSVYRTPDYASSRLKIFTGLTFINVETPGIPETVMIVDTRISSLPQCLLWIYQYL